MKPNGKHALPRVSAIAICKSNAHDPVFIFAVLLDGDWVDSKPVEYGMLVSLIQDPSVLVVYQYCPMCAQQLEGRGR